MKAIKFVLSLLLLFFAGCAPDAPKPPPAPPKPAPSIPAMACPYAEGQLFDAPCTVPGMTCDFTTPGVNGVGAGTVRCVCAADGLENCGAV